jgi:hypothetical protein
MQTTTFIYVERPSRRSPLVSLYHRHHPPLAHQPILCGGVFNLSVRQVLSSESYSCVVDLQCVVDEHRYSFTLMKPNRFESKSYNYRVSNPLYPLFHDHIYIHLTQIIEAKVLPLSKSSHHTCRPRRLHLPPICHRPQNERGFLRRARRLQWIGLALPS